ncbi:MAG: hypothetical protein KF871_00580 [Hydrogenophaga sp.]|uniref:hypothetical protein n=1 Tax=Hydrogenophaga sp. TaxID=1904254 RepID=UPI001D921773|nr:hypothetical protein [Hydrogenophaga sp.]MBX3608361.1 hypothetical protein [Hydrogenophaga sp.]
MSPTLNLKTATLLIGLGLFGASAAHADGKLRLMRNNADGGAGTTVIKKRSGELGTAARARTWQSDGQGNAGTVGGSAIAGPNGGRAARLGGTTVNADGSASHQSGVRAVGPEGSTLQSQGSATRDADGNVTQSRSTAATNANTGNSVQSASSYDSVNGRTRTTTCYDASGAVMACPSR